MFCPSHHYSVRELTLFRFQRDQQFVSLLPAPTVSDDDVILAIGFMCNYFDVMQPLSLFQISQEVFITEV